MTITIIKFLNVLLYLYKYAMIRGKNLTIDLHKIGLIIWYLSQTYNTPNKLLIIILIIIPTVPVNQNLGVNKKSSELIFAGC